MRFDADHKFHDVVNPTPDSELGDIVFEASLRDLELQFKGGLSIEEHPTLFTDPREAEREAIARMVALRISKVVVSERGKAKLEEARRVELHDVDGTVIFGADLPGQPE